MTHQHLLHVIPSYAPGGVPLRITSLINHFGSHFRHTLIATNGDTSCQSRVDDGIDIRFVEPPASGKGLWGRACNNRKILKDITPDLLLTYQWGAMEWALSNRFLPLVPHVHLESGFGPEEAHRQLKRRIWMRRLALGNIRHLIVPSLALVQLARNIWRLPEHKILYIPNGVDCDRYGAPPAPGGIDGFKPVPGEKIIGTVTPLRAEKNLGRLIRAFAHCCSEGQIENIRLVILGEGQERAHLEALVRERGLQGRVLMPGHVHAPERWLGYFDIYALSSDTEQMPNAVLQAMAAGKAVVGLDVGDVKHIVAPENKAMIAPRGDEASFAANMMSLLTDDSLRTTVALANRRHVCSHYDQSKMFEAYLKVWTLK